MHIVHHDKKLARLYTEARGFWDLAEAMAFHTEVAAACRDAARAGRPLTILADLSEYVPQGGPISDMMERTAAVLRAVPKERYALIASSALHRMRIRRLLAGTTFDIFADAPAAIDWLDWTADYFGRLPRTAPSAPTVTAAETGAEAAPADASAPVPTYGRAVAA